MDPQLSQDSLDSLLPMPQSVSDPVTPEPPHAHLPTTSANAISKLQASRVDSSNHMTPPPSTQVVPSSQRGKTRTPTPTMSHISTPPPTIELQGQSQGNRVSGRFADSMTAEQIASASAEELRSKMTEMQSALQEAKMSAAHHKLQYQMLSQQTSAEIERMAVEARMTQYENEIIHVAEQARAAATPAQPSPFQEGMIPVQKDLYQRMCREIQDLTEERKWLLDDQAQKEKAIMRQDIEIASLGDKVALMRDRIREYRESSQVQTARPISRYESTPRSTFNDYIRRGAPSHEQPQPFAALLQASEMASQEARRPANVKKGHVRNTQSTSSLPSTPQRVHKQASQSYYTPSNRHAHPKMPSTAPQPRTSALRRTPDIYAQHALPTTTTSHAQQGPLSDGTVSASEEDSEAETDILEPGDSVNESQASRTASQMLRTSQEERREKQRSFEGRGMLERSGGKGEPKQSRLFGAVRKRGVEDVGGEDGSPVKRARGDAGGVGLGIAGFRG